MRDPTAEVFATLTDVKRVWAVGAIHGDASRLRALHQGITARFQPGDRFVYHGNYLGHGGEVTATRAEQQATLQRFQGRAAKKAGFVRGGALLLTGKGKSFGANGALPGGRFETDATGKLTRRMF